MQGASKRQVILLHGKWKEDDGAIVNGSTTIEMDAPIDSIPCYTSIN